MKKRMVLLGWLVISLLPVQSAMAAQQGLKPGDKVGNGNMVVSKGRHGGVILGLACAGRQTDCLLPPVQKIDIGPDWWTKDQAHLDSSWPNIAWELYIDGQKVNLPAFGDVPEIAPRKNLPDHAPDEIVNNPSRAWDVALLDPSPGTHTWHMVATITQPTNDGWGDYPVGPIEETISFRIAQSAPAVDPYTIDNMAPQTQSSLPSTGGGAQQNLLIICLALVVLATLVIAVILRGVFAPIERI